MEPISEDSHREESVPIDGGPGWRVYNQWKKPIITDNLTFVKLYSVRSLAHVTSLPELRWRSRAFNLFTHSFNFLLRAPLLTSFAKMTFSVRSLAAIAALVSAVSAQSVVGSPYGFASGVTGGGDAEASTPSSAEELAEWLSDDTPRTIVIDQEYDFTGTTATGAGCSRISCSPENGGQLFLGDLSCGGDDNVAIDSIEYDVAGTEPLIVGSNKSIIGNGQGVLIGKGLRLEKGSSNVIIQGVEITNLNPSIVWGGDAIDFQGENDGVWVDHCKVSLIGRMFVVTHYDGSRITLSNNEFDGVTDTSASCNGNHYWTMMFYGEGDQITLDKNYFHDVAGRAPKLGEDGTSATFQASNNYFQNMKGHAFDAYRGSVAILEGNVFESVDQPMTDAATEVSTIFNTADDSAAALCESYIGRACAVNSVDSSSGDYPAMSETSALETWADLTDFLVEPIDAGEVASYVSSNAGPGNLGASETTDPAPVEESDEDVEIVDEDEEAEAPAETPEAVPEDDSDEDAGSVEVAQQYAQCGGNSYSGPKACADGTSCVVQNEWYSQCLSSAARRKMKRSVHRA